MWKLLYRVEGLTDLRTIFQDHVMKAGLSSVARATQGTVSAEGKQENMVSRYTAMSLHRTPLEDYKPLRCIGSQELRFGSIGGLQEERFDCREAIRGRYRVCCSA